jgi:hypothetical protein
MMFAFCANLHSSLLMVLCRSSLQFGFCADQQIIFVLVQFFPKSLNRWVFVFIFTLTDIVIDDWEFSVESFLWRLVVTFAQWGCWVAGKEGRIRLGWGRRQSHLTYFQADAFFYLWLKMISLGSSLFPFFFLITR